MRKIGRVLLGTLALDRNSGSLTVSIGNKYTNNERIEDVLHHVSYTCSTFVQLKALSGLKHLVDLETVYLASSPGTLR